MDWSFRYEGHPNGLEAALEKHRQSAKLFPDDRTQFELVAKLLEAEATKLPQSTKSVTVVARGSGELAPTPSEGGPKAVQRELVLSVSAR